MAISYRFACRRRTAADWTSLNEVLLLAEIGLETDTGKFKFGDGATAWNSLAYYGAALWQPLKANLTQLGALVDPNADRLLFWDDSAGTFAHLTLGTNLSITGTTINATGGGGGISTGASNPGSPSTNDLFYRTDLSLFIVYDGTRWLTTNEYTLSHQIDNLAFPITATQGAVPRWPVPSDYGIYLTRYIQTSFVQTTNSGTSYWTFTLQRRTNANVATTLGSIENTSADTADRWTPHDINLNVVLDATAKNISMVLTKVSSPGALYYQPTLLYRKIIT